MIFSSILMIFWSLLKIDSIVAQKLNRFICKNFFEFFDTKAIPEAVKVGEREE